MKYAILLLVGILAPSLTTRGAALPNNEHNQWVADSLREMQTIKVGMRRSDLEKIFEIDGGLSEPAHRTYVYRRCPYFKVDVEFAPAHSQGDSREDKVVKISTPYLGWTAGD